VLEAKQMPRLRPPQIGKPGQPGIAAREENGRARENRRRPRRGPEPIERKPSALVALAGKVKHNGEPEKKNGALFPSQKRHYCWAAQ
jgi:hypothetical protein